MRAVFEVIFWGVVILLVALALSAGIGGSIMGLIAFGLLAGVVVMWRPEMKGRMVK